MLDPIRSSLSLSPRSWTSGGATATTMRRTSIRRPSMSNTNKGAVPVRSSQYKEFIFFSMQLTWTDPRHGPRAHNSISNLCHNFIVVITAQITVAPIERIEPRDTCGVTPLPLQRVTRHTHCVQRVYDARCLFQHCASLPPLAHLQTSALFFARSSLHPALACCHASRR